MSALNITSSYQVRIVNCSVNLIDTVRIAAHKKGISLESKRKRHPGKGRKNHHGIGRCFDARLDMPKAIAKGDDICALRHIK